MKTQLDIYAAANALALRLADTADEHDVEGQVWDAAEAQPVADRASFKTHFAECRARTRSLKTQTAPSEKDKPQATPAKKITTA